MDRYTSTLHSLLLSNAVLQEWIFQETLPNDLVVIGEDSVEIDVFKKQMTSEFEMSDLGLLSFYLGIEVDQ